MPAEHPLTPRSCRVFLGISLISRPLREKSLNWLAMPPWNKKKDRPSVLDAERLMRRHREQIQRLLSKWARDEGKTEGDAA